MNITKKELHELLLFWLDLCERTIKENELTSADIVTLIHNHESMVAGLSYLFVDYPNALFLIKIASDHLQLMKKPYLIVTTTHRIECLDEHCLGCDATSKYPPEYDINDERDIRDTFGGLTD